MCRQGARRVTSLGIMLSSPFLVFPGRRGGVEGTESKRRRRGGRRGGRGEGGRGEGGRKGRRRGREEGEEEREGEMVEEYEGQLKYRNGSVSRTRVSSHTKNVTPPQPIMQLLKLLFCGSVRERERVCMCVCVCV